MLNDGCDAIVRNNLFAGNVADGSQGFAGPIPGIGGGLFARDSDPIVVNNTFFFNVASSPDPSQAEGTGGAIHLQGSGEEAESTSRAGLHSSRGTRSSTTMRSSSWDPMDEAAGSSASIPTSSSVTMPSS